MIKAASFDFRGVQAGDSACGCVRGVAVKTCGGTVFEADGVTPATDCTLDDSPCAGKNACAYVHGAGNVASGFVRCDGLDGVDAAFTQDSGGSFGQAGLPAVHLSSIGAAGSGRIMLTTAVGVIGGACTGTSGGYGADGEFCTADDPPSAWGLAVTAPLVTGNAKGVVFNANGIDGVVIEPPGVTGRPFDCRALAAGSASEGALAGAFTALAQQPTTTETPTATRTPTATTTRRPTLTPTVPACPGDCNGDGVVTVDELLTMVNVALGNAEVATCTAGDTNGDGSITVDEILAAVNTALNGCWA